MIALTGSSGFVGSEVVRLAAKHQVAVVPLIRQAGAMVQGTGGMVPRVVGDLGTGPIDHSVLAGCTTVIHAAARAHRMGESGNVALARYRQANVDGTRLLIEAMVRARVRRLVYISSIKALGERSPSEPLAPEDVPAPEDPYGISKAEAEEVVHAAHREGRIEGLIIRPVLVHGPEAKGNLERLMQAIWCGRLLPFGRIFNRRSMLGIHNFAEALLAVATSATSGDQGPTPKRDQASAPIYHLADDGTISTSRLAEVLAEGLGVRARLIAIPRWLAVGSASILRKGGTARRLYDDLEVDDRNFREAFSWRPRVGLEDGLRLMAADYARRQRNNG